MEMENNKEIASIDISKKLKECEEKNKDEILQSISEISTKEMQIIETINESLRFLGLNEENIANVGIITNNKISEISHELKKLDLSLYAEYDAMPAIGQIIIDDLVNKTTESINELSEYLKELNSIVERKTNQINDWNNMNPIKKFFTTKKLDTSITEDEKNKINCGLKNYEQAVNDIWNYTLENNLVEAIVNYMVSNPVYNNQVVAEDYIVPYLKKLNLEELIPELKRALEDIDTKEKTYYESSNLSLDESVAYESNDDELSNSVMKK